MKKTETVSKIEGLINNAVSNLGYKQINFKIEHPTDLRFGDLASNIALGLARELKAKPVEIAQKISEEILRIQETDLVEKIEVAGIGFLNFFLKTDYLIEQAEEMNYSAEFRHKLSQHGSGKKLIIDYSSPNIAKPFGIGHLRSTNIGQAIYNLYQMLGWSTIGDNHLGDWGTQFGKLIVAIKKWGDKPVEKMVIGDLEKLYIRFHKEVETEEALEDEAREWFSKLENGDNEAKAIWQKCVNISVQEFDSVYQMLGVSIDMAKGESFYLDKTGAVIEMLVEKKVAVESQGALIVEFKNMPPAMVKKSNGTTTYFARDLAAIKYRMDQWHPELIIYEVGADQELYFRQLFETAKNLDWWPTEGMVHVAHGLIRWQGGKFSTRKGDTIHLSEVVDKAMVEAKKIADVSKISKEMSQTERNEMIKKVALGAVKFSDLAADPKKDIIFDWDKIMSLDGDSGPYLQYTYARCLSVLSKSRIREQNEIGIANISLSSSENQLLRSFYIFEEKIIDAAEKFNPSILAEYLLDLARKYNEFYAKDKIIDTEEEVFRVFLTKTTASIIKIGLEILGIETINKM